MKHKNNRIDLLRGFAYYARQPKTILLTEYDENGNAKPERKITL